MEYGAATHYMNLFLEALPLWHEWNKERAENNLVPVYHQTGLISFAENGTFTQYELDCMSQIREAGYGHLIEELDTPEKIIERFPRFEKAVKNGFDIAVYNKEGGENHMQRHGYFYD
jgi:sarcosine oxidase/L-pipecolate oxidase